GEIPHRCTLAMIEAPGNPTLPLLIFATAIGDEKNYQESKGPLMSKHNNRSEENGMPAFETNLFGDLMAFHQQIVARLREESLNDYEQQLVMDRLNDLIQAEIKDMELTKDLDMTKRLESVSKQIHRFIDELSGSE